LSRWLIVIGLLLLFSLPATPIGAQDYAFGVPKLEMQVFVQEDGSVKLVYDITFQNTASGHSIDIVDMGMPNGKYAIRNMSASVDGTPLTNIRPSEFVKPGVEVHLGAASIPRGESGEFHFEATIPGLVNQDVTDKDLASLQITPTWFGSEFVRGDTDLKIAIHLPEGVAAEEVLYQNQPFSQKAIFQDRAVALWEFPATRLTGPHKVGVSFPKRFVNNIVRVNVFQLALRWWQDQVQLRTGLVVAFLVFFSFFYFRLTGGTGFIPWALMVTGLGWIFLNEPIIHALAFVPLVAGGVLVQQHLSRSRTRYLPPIAQVEGGGIKRGLTAPQAAALLEMPVNKVLTLIVFGLLKKGVLLERSPTPLIVDIDEAFQVDDSLDEKSAFDQWIKSAQVKGIVLHLYELRFLHAIASRPGIALQKHRFAKPMEWFINDLAQRMKGFDLSDTRDYYKAIVQKAIDDARDFGDIAGREEIIERNLEWILIDPHFPVVLETPVNPYRPTWIRPISIGKSASGGLPGRVDSSPGSSGVGLSDVAAGFAGWTENTMDGMAFAILPSSMSTVPSRGGAIDLSGVDENIFKAITSGEGGSGGGGGGGCACAGCACACACAGGGR
jgi:hypothetical protein